ncbi:MAG: nicotinate (nicotinamide) nucleotide adenylyltransferase [Ruminococcaceae bacterium]|nr:nicotinate (nicotinamide) nucleotide adenylyltransferase [Oscillospiraceae bacterium]
MVERGIYGGTFSPVHNGHVRAANAFYDLLSLEELFVVPTFLPPHKPEAVGCSAEDRLAMTRLAFADNPRRVTVSDYEILSGGTSYTYKTLMHFSAPDVRLTFLCGTDMFLTLPQWKHPDKLFALARIAHVRRTVLSEETEEAVLRCAEAYRRIYGGDIVHLQLPPCEISATMVRERCARREPIGDLVPPIVHDYIAAHRLYGNPAAGGLS